MIRIATPAAQVDRRRRYLEALERIAAALEDLAATELARPPERPRPRPGPRPVDR